jgi:hypothetical protein
MGDVRDFGEFVSALYTRFFLRDVLSYIVPGVIVLLPLTVAFPALTKLFWPKVSAFVVILIMGLSYTLGAGLLGFCRWTGWFKYFSSKEDKALQVFMETMVMLTGRDSTTEIRASSSCTL